ncbi:MAG TPA: hypothetical protein VG711_08905 [Phycisphaerales bacterium]|nr:hypothetical protein [Phycisphaerales bacterium]
MAMPVVEDWRTYVMVSVIALLIWVWAATETRQTRTLDNVRIDMGTMTEAGWTVEPSEIRARVTIDGAGPALKDFESVVRNGLPVDIPEVVGEPTLDLRRLVEDTDEVRTQGLRVVSVEPRAVAVKIRQMDK